MEKLSESAIVRSLAQRCSERVTRAAIAQLESIDAGLLGDDTGLSNLWEEICAQVQRRTSPWWRHYQDAIWLVVDEQVAGLEDFERAAIWLQTPEGDSWYCKEESDRRPYPASGTDIVRYIVHEHLLFEAAYWRSPAIDGYVNRC